MKFFVIFSFLAFFSTAQAQFGGIFEQMFGQQQQHGSQQRRVQQASSDADGYRQQYNGLNCENYLCPDTLACVSFPHHCPCPWPDHTDKFEMGETSRICLSKGGFREGEAARKLELARQNKL